MAEAPYPVSLELDAPLEVARTQRAAGGGRLCTDVSRDPSRRRVHDTRTGRFDITLAELSIESFFPADERTAEALRKS
jgi:hypothetical protein